MTKSMVTFQVAGLERLRKNLRALTDSLRGEIMRTALTTGALEIVNEAKSQAPILTGTLRRSIHIGAHTDMTDFKADEGYDDIKGEMVEANKVTICVGTNLVYARIQEYGGTISAKKAPYLVFRVNGQWVRTKQVTLKGHPYMRPAFDTKKEDMINVFRDELAAQIRRNIT